MLMDEREQRTKERFEQLVEGAITYFEFANWVNAQVTEADLKRSGMDNSRIKRKC